ncbi:MAG: tyrosine-type recombinase/integrase [Clostridia bacterium]|nr:tyrosine-type recombinase/integrase [Clostridia bacterium]
MNFGYIRGGSKTKAGKNRFVPIHKDVFYLIENRMKIDGDFLFQKESGHAMNYYEYRNRFNKVMKKLNMNHFPHDTRHTFITLGKNCNMNEYVLKRIVGHAIQDVTEVVYTHRNQQDFYDEICKIKV